MFHFYWPWFAVLLPLPFLVRWLAPARRENATEGVARLYFPNLKKVKEAFPAFQASAKKKNLLTVALLSMAWICLIAALMQPEYVDQYTYVRNEGHDIVLAVDISPSMQALDFSTKSTVINRLDVTKDVVGKFVKGRQGDRVGLIIFGENAYLHAPLTLDTNAVANLLNDTLPGMAGSTTAIGDAIGLAVRTLRGRPEGSRVLILLTDGVDNTSSIPPLEAAKLAKRYGIRIYTIGVGKQGAVPYPTSYGGFQMVDITIDEELLQNIASATGGQYFHAGDKAHLEKIYDKIDALEKTEAETEELLIRDPLYRYPLALALFLFFLAAVRPLFRSAAYGL